MEKTLFFEDKISSRDSKHIMCNVSGEDVKISKPLINDNGDVISELGETLFTDSIHEKRNVFNAARIAKSGKAPVFYTEIEIYENNGDDRNEDWKLKSIEHNELVLPGALFMAEKLTNVDAPIQPKTINSDLGIAVTENNTGMHGKRRENAIALFGVGTGGSGLNFNTVVPVNYNERVIENFIPIRRVKTDTDLSSVEKEKYFMKKVNNGFYEYYLKKFEIDPTIKVEYDEPGAPSVPSDFDKQPASKLINLYMQFNVKISKYDVREYFKTIGGGIEQARINTLGLFVGYPEVIGSDTEYKGVQLFSKLNFNNEPLDNETKELNIIYKIYIA